MSSSSSRSRSIVNTLGNTPMLKNLIKNNEIDIPLNKNIKPKKYKENSLSKNDVIPVNIIREDNYSLRIITKKTPQKINSKSSNMFTRKAKNKKIYPTNMDDDTTTSSIRSKEFTRSLGGKRRRKSNKKTRKYRKK